MGVVLAAAIGVIVGLAAGWFAKQALVRRDKTVSAAAADAATASDSVAPLLRRAVDRIPIGVVVSDQRGKAVYRNAAASEWSGTHVRVLVDGHLDDLMASARRGGQTDRLLEVIGPPRLYLQLSAEPMADGYAVGTITDVSERMRTDAMRTDFVANISHELKTPVGAIAVLAEALLAEPDPAITHRAAQRLVDEAHRAARTIDDLLELARIEAGAELTDAVDIGSVISEAVERGRHVEGPPGVSVAALDLTVPIAVRGDARQLVSAVGNLVENAVKYSSPGGVVQVRTRLADDHLEVMVADQGVGIPARDLERVFERFYRVDRARSRTTGGTGLGLSIVRHVANNHGGDVLVSSRVGEGSTFVLRLPRSSVLSADDAGQSDREGEQAADQVRESVEEFNDG